MMRFFAATLLMLISAFSMADYKGEWDHKTALEKIAAGNVLVLDVRSPSEYKSGHVPGAINVPHKTIKENLSLLNKHKDKDILIYCRSGRRAGFAESALSELGFDNLYHLKGDMNGWQEANMKIEK